MDKIIALLNKQVIARPQSPNRKTVSNLNDSASQTLQCYNCDQSGGQLAGECKSPRKFCSSSREVRTSPNSYDIRMYDNSQTHVNNLMLPNSINGKPIKSVVDTAAQITVISRVFADTFTPPLICGDNVAKKVQKTPTTLRPTAVRILELVLRTWETTLSSGLS